MKTKNHKAIHPATLLLTTLFMALVLQANTCNREQDFKNPMERMVTEQLITRGISSKVVLYAMRIVPRHLFVPEDIQSIADSLTTKTGLRVICVKGDCEYLSAVKVDDDAFKAINISRIAPHGEWNYTISPSI